MIKSKLLRTYATQDLWQAFIYTKFDDDIIHLLEKGL